MAEFELIQTRNISGKGMLRLPSDSKKRRMGILYASVLRPPTSPYYNLNYSPKRSRYAYLTFLRNDYVIADGSIEYEQQSFDVVTDLTGQNLIALKCAYKGILQTFQNFAQAQNLFLESITDTIKDYEYLDLAWDEVRVTCYADTALQLQLYALPFDKCDDESDKPKRPPKPPPPPAPVPPGTPLDGLDPPYEDEENPDNFTEPYPGDDNNPFPFGEECTQYDITLRVIPFVGDPIVLTFRMFGEVEGVGIGGGGSFVYILCRGGRDSIVPPAGACLAEVTECGVFGSSEPTYASVSLVSYEEVPA